MILLNPCDSKHIVTANRVIHFNGLLNYNLKTDPGSKVKTLFTYIAFNSRAKSEIYNKISTEDME